MTRFPISVTALLLITAAPVAAQPGAIVQPLTPNADRLSEQMRILGRSPNDLSALIEAGRLSGKLGDTDAAMQFLARAERVSASDPRIRAARAATLVTMERPGEALAMFDSAERAGLAMAPYAADRGLAYDLLGYPANAQRDYRTALTQGADDEVTRRLALSMGITGDVAGATALLNPLLLQNDRAAWRVRACVLAMSGDAAGADRIAASMLPGFGPSLAPFFRRLPQLSAADRAFAVHFGRLAPTPERLADARLAPAVTPLPRPASPVAVAAVARPTQTRAPTAAERRADQRRRVEAARIAQATEARRIAAERAQSVARARADETARLASLAQARTAQLQAAQAQAAAQAQRERDARQQAEQARLAEATRVEAARIAAREAEERRVAAAALAERDRAAVFPLQVASVPAQGDTPPIETPMATASATPDAAAAPVPVEVVAAPPVAAPGFSSGTVTPAASNAAAVAARSGDDVLARIIRNLDIPAAELGVGPPPVAASQTLAADAEAARATAQAREDEARAIEARRAAEAKKVADAKAAAARKIADAKRLADAKKAEDAAKAAEARKAVELKKADAPRHWVQIAGGANVAGLPAAWRLLSGKAAALKGRQAWTTPLRATNRLLVGPFKSDDEAQAFVNTLGKDGLQAFTFTSAQGQKVVRVPTS